MRKNLQCLKGTVLGLLAIAGLIVLFLGLLYAGILCWAWFSDLKHADVAQDIIDPKAAEYIAQAYPDNDFVLDHSYHVFKDNCYRVKVHSPSSRDTYFTLDYDYKTYELVRDGYESAVLSGSNTRDRLVLAYAQLVEDCVSSEVGSYRIKSDFCKYSENTNPGGHFSPKGLDGKTLILDKEYDVAALGSEYGYLEVSAILPKEEINLPSALKVLREIDQALSEHGIGYCLIEITIEDAEYPDTTAEFYLYGVHPEDLYREDALAFLQELWNTQEALRQERREKWAD